MAERYDLGVIGGGPAGYTAALNAKAQGQSVILFEKDKLGGVCLNRGCIPTKAILHSAEVFEDLKCAENLGISVGADFSVDYSKVIEYKDKVVEKVRKALELTIKNSGIKVVYAQAKPNIADGKVSGVIADGEVYECDKVIMAVGSSPRELPALRFDHEFVLSSDDILKLSKLPKSIAIIGSGAIGIEWARIFSTFGAEVTIIEAAEHLLPIADVEVSKRIERIFKAKKIKMYLSNSVEKVENNTLYLSSGEAINPECVLLAIGRVPNEKDNIDGITYLGDVCGEIQLAHYAIKQAIDKVCGVKFETDLVPSVVYGNPEIAWIGKREQDLEEGTYKKSMMLISALGKSHCDNSTDGFIKLLSCDGYIVGAHIVSKEASSLIQQVAIAMQNRVSIDKLKEVCFAHPTYSEGIFECLFRL